MADRRVTFVIGANVANFMKNMNKAQRRFARFGRDLERAGRSLSSKVTLPLLGAAGAALKTAADFETLSVQMDVLTGSAEAGAEAFERLKRFSARTPFQLKDLVKAQNTLMGFGEDVETAFEHLQMLGDVAAVTGGDLQAITVAFGQASAEGRLMTRDIRQLINQGVPAIKLLAESMDVAKSEVLDLASEGEITFPKLVKAFRDATQAGGQFEDGTQRLADTMKGVFSTLRDNVMIALGDIGKELDRVLDIKGLMRGFIAGIRNAVEWFKSLSDESKRLGIAIMGIAAATGPTLFLLGKLFRVLSILASPAFLASAAITGLFVGIVTTGQWLLDNWEKISQGFENAMLTMEITAKKMALGVIQSIKSILNFLANFVPAEWLTAIFGIDLSEIALDFAGVNDLIDGLKTDIQSTTQDLEKGINKFNEQAWGSFSDSAKRALELTKNAIINGLQGILSSSEIQELIGKIQGFVSVSAGGTGIDEGGGRTSRLTDNLIQIGNVSTTVANTVSTNMGKMRRATSDFSTAAEAALQKVKFTWEDFQEFLDRFSDQFKSLVVNQISNSVISFGETVGQTLAGVEGQFKTTFEKIVIIFLDFAKQIAKLAATIGALLLFVPGGQGAGIGLLSGAAAVTAAAAGIEAGINKRAANRRERAQGMAIGGIIPPGFPNDSYPAMLSSGETVIPAPKPLPSGGGRQVIENVVMLDGREVYRNQKEVNNRVNR